MKQVLLVVGNTKCNYIRYKLFQKNENLKISLKLFANFYFCKFQSLRFFFIVSMTIIHFISLLKKTNSIVKLC